MGAVDSPPHSRLDWIDGGWLEAHRPRPLLEPRTERVQLAACHTCSHFAFACSCTLRCHTCFPLRPCHNLQPSPGLARTSWLVPLRTGASALGLAPCCLYVHLLVYCLDSAP